jgi:hypothetical protein
MTCKKALNQEEEIVLTEDQRGENSVRELISSNILATNNTNASELGDTS